MRATSRRFDPNLQKVRIDEFRKKFRCGRGNRGSPVGVFKYDKVAIICIDNDGTGFLTYQQPAEVIPRTMCVPRAIDVAIDNTTRDCAQVERARPK